MKRSRIIHGIFFSFAICSQLILSQYKDEQFDKQWAEMRTQYIDLCDHLTDQGYAQFDAQYYHPAWSSIINATKELILGPSDQNYLYKPFIGSTMVRFNVEPEVIEYEKNLLLYTINDGLKKLIETYREPGVGKIPKECAELNCSQNALGMLFYAATVLSKTKALKTIIEFGSGYGCLANIFKQLLPDATIFLIDSPEFLSLQYLYLTIAMPNVKVIVHQHIPENYEPGAIHLIPTLFLNNLTLSADLFISTFALSETPRLVQDIVIEKKFFGAEYCYIVGQINDGIFENHGSLCDGIKGLYNTIIDRPFHIARAQSYEILGAIKAGHQDY